MRTPSDLLFYVFMLDAQEVAARLRAAGLHFLVTLLIAALAAGLVFGVWFPAPFARMLGGLELFFLVVICDVVLGPLLSLVIYNRRKPRGELIRDYAVVALVQLAALLYGLHAVAVTRPAFVVFSVDRYEVVSAGALAEEDLADAVEPAWRHAPWTGPVFVRAERPQSSQERAAVLFGSLTGKDLSSLPKYYRPMAGAEAQVLSRAQELATLTERRPELRHMLDETLASHGRASESLRWLPVRHARGFWTVLVDARTGTPVEWLPVDPY